MGLDVIYCLPVSDIVLTLLILRYPVWFFFFLLYSTFLSVFESLYYIMNFQLFHPHTEEIFVNLCAVTLVQLMSSPQVNVDIKPDVIVLFKVLSIYLD